MSATWHLQYSRGKYLLGSVHLCSLLRRQGSTIKDDDGRDSMVLKQSDAIHCIVDESNAIQVSSEQS